MEKRDIGDLAIFNGPRAFLTPISTSNLPQPDIDNFLAYSRKFYEAKHYTNNGPNVRLLESRLAQFHQAKHCIAFANGFWAIVLTLKALALPGKTEIVIPSLTYRRLADITAWLRLVPRFCEVDEHTLSITAETVTNCINDQTAAILAAHPIVNCCDAEAIASVGLRAGIPTVFDSVESVYESVAGGKIGSFGNAECFSLHASKLVNGFEGGYVTTNDGDLARRLMHMRGFGFIGQDTIVELGLNAKLCEPHACMALACLDDLEDQVIRNRMRYYRYRDSLQKIPGLRLLEFDESNRTSYKNIVVEITAAWPLSRKLTLEILHAEGVLARPYYSPPLHKKNMSYPYIPAELPVTEQLADKFLLLPCGHFVTTEDIDRLCDLFVFMQDNANGIMEQLQP